ncbi:ankyrin, partial [Peniophora sp. CONT]
MLIPGEQIGTTSAPESEIVYGPLLPRNAPFSDRATVNLSFSEYEDRPLHLAAKNGDIDSVRSLLDSGVDLEALDADGSTPLFLAAERGYIAVASLLVDRGANVHVHCESAILHSSQSVLQVASEGGHSEVVHLLLRRGADVNGHIEGEQSSLSLAIVHGHIDVVRLLLDYGGDL